MEKLLLTIEEAAEVLSIGRTALYELMHQERLRWVTIGRSRRIPADALVEFVDGLRTNAAHRDSSQAECPPGDRAPRLEPPSSCQCATTGPTRS